MVEVSKASAHKNTYEAGGQGWVVLNNVFLYLVEPTLREKINRLLKGFLHSVLIRQQILSYKQGLMDLLGISVLNYSSGGTAGIAATAGSGPSPSELYK